MTPISDASRSDTVTRPTGGMRHAMAEAEVGDDVFGGDPTVMRLEAGGRGGTDGHCYLHETAELGLTSN